MPPKVKKQAGLSMLELMVSIGITGGIAVILATLFDFQNLGMRDLKYSLEMSQISNRIESAIGRTDVLAESASRRFFLASGAGNGNQKLYDCLTDDGDASDCTATDAQNQVSFSLILPTENPTPELIKKLTLAGSSSHPIYYDLKGKKDCMPEIGSLCQFVATAYFWATCPPEVDAAKVIDDQELPEEAPSKCKIAQSIHVRYKIKHQYKASKHIHRKLADKPRESALGVADNADPYGATSIAVSQIPNLEQTKWKCAPNFTIVQVEDGKPNCKCLYPNKLYKSSGAEICLPVTNQSCGPNQRYQGRDSNGYIICQNVDCKTISVSNSSNIGFNCGSGWWVKSISIIDTCRSEQCRVGTGGECKSKVACDFKITCCQEPHH